MQFAEALAMMKQGYRMKRPSWGGFWVWDNDRQTIIMHCRPDDSDPVAYGGDDSISFWNAEGDIKHAHVGIDIRGTVRVEYTLSNILATDWIEATSENCTLLGGLPKMNFDTAVEYAKRGINMVRTYNPATSLNIEDITALDWTFDNATSREIIEQLNSNEPDPEFCKGDNQ